MKNKVCRNCGKIINEEEDLVHIVNHGLPDEHILCEECCDDDWERSRIVHCDACGEWITPNNLHDERLTDECIFTPCPICKRDIIEACTRAEMTEMCGRKLPNYLMEDLRGYMGVDWSNTRRDDEINDMNGREILDAWLNTQGIIGYTDKILNVIKYAYGIDLTEK